MDIEDSVQNLHAVLKQEHVLNVTLLLKSTQVSINIHIFIIVVIVII